MFTISSQIIPFLSGAGAFILAYFMIPVIIDVSHLKHLFDDPENDRKLHSVNTPNLGGAAIFGAFSIAFLLSGFASVQWAPYLVAGLMILFFSGIKDDILVLSPYKKLLLQFGAILAVMLGGGAIITDFGGVFGVHEVSYVIGFAITFFTMVVVINAYNLIDGIDGLAGGIGFITTAFFGVWFWSMGMMAHATLAVTLACALLAFLRYNFEPAFIFMGDTGSQIVGFILGYLAVIFVQTGITSTGSVPFEGAIPVIVLAVLIVPLYDTLRVFTIRVLNGTSPFHPDRRHVHHQLIDCGFSHQSSSIIIYSFNLITIGLTIALADLDINLLFGVVLLTAIVLFPTAQFKRRLLKKIGFPIPSASWVNTLENKLNFPTKSVGESKSDYDSQKKKKKRDRSQKVAV